MEQKNLPNDIRIEKSLQSFKKKVKIENIYTAIADYVNIMSLVWDLIGVLYCFN